MRRYLSQLSLGYGRLKKHSSKVSLQSRVTEDELYDLSLEREPRNHDQSNSHKSIKEKPVFAEWASGIHITPDRETVEKYVNAMVEAVFKVYDTDKNGTINQNEFGAITTNFPFVDNFAMMDTNCDGIISKEEMRNYFMNVSFHTMTREFIHNFQETTTITPTYCEYCMGLEQYNRDYNKIYTEKRSYISSDPLKQRLVPLVYLYEEGIALFTFIWLWGLGKSAVKCKDCHITCHKDCKDHVVMECRPRNNSTLTRDESKIKILKNRLKYLDRYLDESAESQSSTTCVSNSNDKIDSLMPSEAELPIEERLRKAEEERKLIAQENVKLKEELLRTKSQVNTLSLQVTQLKQQSWFSMLEALQKLNLQKQTDV